MKKILIIIFSGILALSFVTYSISFFNNQFKTMENIILNLIQISKTTESTLAEIEQKIDSNIEKVGQCCALTSEDKANAKFTQSFLDLQMLYQINLCICSGKFNDIEKLFKSSERYTQVYDMIKESPKVGTEHMIMQLINALDQINLAQNKDNNIINQVFILESAKFKNLIQQAIYSLQEQMDGCKMTGCPKQIKIPKINDKTVEILLDEYNNRIILHCAINVAFKNLLNEIGQS